MQISGSNGTTKPADYQPGINNMGLFNYAKSVVSTAVNTPVHALLRSFRDNVLAEHVTPVPGSVLYCDLAAGYAVGKKSVARVALELVGQDLGRYNIAINNCHMFTCLCLCKKIPIY